MKKIYVLLLFIACQLLVVYFLFAQKQANKWYFGSYAGIDFNSGSPVPFSGSAMYILEGCASIADTAGNTLFYTNGVQVWNKNNVQMANGFGLLGNDNAAQSAIIVPAPSNITLYYIFTAPTNGNTQLHYSIVDMTLNSGLGDVTIKNAPLFNNSTEKVTAVQHANGTDIWVIGHEYNSNNFYAYLVTSSGVSATPVVTGSGSVHSGWLGFAGYMKTSHNGSKIACAVTVPMNITEVFDFNNTTGVISNPILFNNITEAYGLEFSPDDSKLYVTEENPQLIEQWDLSLGTAAAITASQTTIGSGTGNGFAALQLAPDGKIYLAKRMNIGDLGVINNPNNAGLACNFVDHAVVLVGGTSMYGLPNFVQSLFSPSTTLPVASFQSSDTTFCNETGACIDFYDHSTGNPTSWKWYFPGAVPDSSIQQNPTNICYYQPGTYPVTLIISNGAGSDTLDVSPHIIFFTTPAAPNLTVSGDTITCSPEASYQWYYNGSPIPNATDSFYVYLQTGTYAVMITDSNGCSRLSNGVLITALLENSPFQEGLTLFPNPFSSIVTLQLHSTVKNAEVVICDMPGKEVLRKYFSGAMTEIERGSLAKGIYLLRLRTEEREYSRLLIAQ